MKLKLILPCVLLFSLLVDSKAQDSLATEVTINAFETLQKKFIQIANDFPEDLFDYKPHPDSRSYIKEMWHVTSGFGVLLAQLEGKRPGKELINIPEEIVYKREELINRLTSFSKNYIEKLRENYNPNSIYGLAHLSEHYGKIVTIYRANGLVPPNSRDK